MFNFSQTKIILLLKCHVCALVQIKWHQPDFCKTGLKAKVCLGVYVYHTETDRQNKWAVNGASPVSPPPLWSSWFCSCSPEWADPAVYQWTPACPPSPLSSLNNESWTTQ